MDGDGWFPWWRFTKVDSPLRWGRYGLPWLRDKGHTIGETDVRLEKAKPGDGGLKGTGKSEAKGPKGKGKSKKGKKVRKNSKGK